MIWMGVSRIALIRKAVIAGADATSLGSLKILRPNLPEADRSW